MLNKKVCYCCTKEDNMKQRNSALCKYKNIRPVIDGVCADYERTGAKKEAAVAHEVLDKSSEIYGELAYWGTAEEFEANFEDYWKSGRVRCPNSAFVYYHRCITAKVPERCPFKLEHMVNKKIS
jgi:hypothetical protein